MSKAARGKIDPLTFNAEQDLIDGTRFKRLELPLQALQSPLLASPDSALVRRWMAIAVAMTAFMNGTMASVAVPVAVDFLQYESDDMLDKLKYGSLFACSPLVAVLFLVPAMWLAQLDRQYGGLSMLTVTFVCWTGSSLASACASLVQGGQRLGVMLLARTVNGLASSSGSMAVVNAVGTATNDENQRLSMLLMTVVLFEAGQVFGMLLSGLATLSGVVRGWQITFCITASLAAVGAGVVSLARHELGKYSIDTRPFMPNLAALVRILKTPLAIILSLAYFLVIASSVQTAIISPLWIRGFAPTTIAAVTAVLLSTRNILFLFVLLMRCFAQPSATVRRWRALVFSTLLLSVAFVVFTIMDSTTSHVSAIVLPLSIVGFASGEVEINLFSVLASILNDRGSSHFGELRFLQVFLMLISYFIAPLFAVSMTSLVSFDWLFYITALLLALFTPFIAVLKSYEERVLAEHDHTSDNIAGDG
ncbi:uncharacterized protein LOC135813570 [Sycon ciliatum]|uniref:uncharacterized protein LOC135813570 n=1 Tax=Sycon ciliatum TaxID=27933 RepID=UPI0031F62B07